MSKFKKRNENKMEMSISVRQANIDDQLNLGF